MDIVSSPRLLKRFPAKFSRYLSASPHWKTYLSIAPATGSGPSRTAKRKRRTLDPDGDANIHNAGRGARDCRTPRQHLVWPAAGAFAVVARDRSLLSAAQPRRRRDCLAHSVLARDWLRLRHVHPQRRRGRRELSEIFFPRRADHDRAVHLDLHHDVGDRGS